MWVRLPPFPQMTILLIILCAVSTWMQWNAIHELSHLAMAHLLVGVDEYELKLYPHRYKDSWRFASFRYRPKRLPSAEETAAILLAPRIPNIISALVLPLVALLPIFSSLWIMGVVFWIGGLLDLWVGSWGAKSYSDLQRAAHHLGIDPGVLQRAGKLLIVLSVLLFVAIL